MHRTSANPDITGIKPAAHLLRSWKEISAYMALGTRTAQRYEAKLGLPIHRPVNGGPRCAVWAFSDEIDAWLRRPEGVWVERQRFAKIKLATNGSGAANVSPVVPVKVNNAAESLAHARETLPPQPFARLKANA